MKQTRNSNEMNNFERKIGINHIPIDAHFKLKISVDLLQNGYYQKIS